MLLLPETLRKVIDTTDIFTFIATIEDQPGIKDADSDIEI